MHMCLVAALEKHVSTAALRWSSGLLCCGMCFRMVVKGTCCHLDEYFWCPVIRALRTFLFCCTGPQRYLWDMRFLGAMLVT